ncbi:MAG: hypothetical protein ACREQ2_01515 [Candidatus Binatia bacterium]
MSPLVTQLCNSDKTDFGRRLSREEFIHSDAVLIAILVGIEPWAVRQARSAAPVIQVVEITGHPLSEPCDPLASHGFFGIEQKVIEAITKWIKHIEQ